MTRNRIAMPVALVGLYLAGCGGNGHESLRNQEVTTVVEPQTTSVTYDLGLDPLFAFGPAPTNSQLAEREFVAVAAPSINIFEQGELKLRFNDGSLTLVGGCKTAYGSYSISRDGQLATESITESINASCSVDGPVDRAIAMLKVKPLLQLRDDTLKDGTWKLLMTGDRVGLLLFVVPAK